MSSFASYIPGSESDPTRLNPGRKRPAPSPRIDDFELAQRAQRNEMFFTDADDQDSIFGSDDFAVIEESTLRQRQSQPQNQSPRNQGVQNGRAPNNGASNTARSNINSRTSNKANNRNSPRRPVSSTTRGPTTPTSAVLETIQIKDEDAETDNTMDADYLRNIPTNQRVKIFVGRKNRSIQVNRADLSKSPILQSYIVDDPIQGSFIMRPQLMTTHYEDFAAVAQFLRNGEYAPLLLQNAADAQGPKVLSELKNDEEYAREFVKAAKLYGLAKSFGIHGMAELVFKKVTEVDSGKYSISSLVKVAEIVFKDTKNRTETAADSSRATETGSASGEATQGISTGGIASDKDPLEEWIVGKLAYNFQEIMRIQRDKFFEVAKVTGKKMLYSRVLEKVAGQYRASGGKLPEPVIELD